jgi:hypothetical protein
MDEMSLAAREASKRPSVALDQADDLAHLHRPMLATVNGLHKMAGTAARR